MSKGTQGDRGVGVSAPDPGALDDETIVIVGAGFGGLSAAAHLGAAGADVTVFERHERVGGVAGRIERDGFRIDTGPSWYLMPEVFERFFGRFGHSPEEFYETTHLDPHYRVFWKDGDSIDIPPNADAAKQLFESREDGAGSALDRYLEEAEEAYRIGMDRFVYTDRSRFRDMLDPDVVRSARGISLLGTMDDHVAKYFDDPKLRQLVQYSLVFLGGSPHNTPALYNLMSHVDYNLGVYYPDGGIASVVDAVAEVAREQGVTIETSAEVETITPTPDGHEITVNNQRVGADRVVANAPPSSVESELLPTGCVDRSSDYWETRTYAPSAFLLYLGVEGSLDQLEHHTLVLPADWDPHFESIFDNPGWPDDPAYYVSVPSRTDDGVAPDGHETVVVLVPIAPGLEDGPERRDQFRRQVLDDLAEFTGADLRDRIVLEEVACVSEFADRYSAPEGTALGMAHTLFQTGPLRPSHRVPGVDNLYYVGSYTNPGIGVPMTLIGGRHVLESVIADTGSRRPLRRLFDLPTGIPTPFSWR